MSFMVCTPLRSVIVDQVHVHGLAVLETEQHAPVATALRLPERLPFIELLTLHGRVEAAVEHGLTDGDQGPDAVIILIVAARELRGRGTRECPHGRPHRPDRILNRRRSCRSCGAEGPDRPDGRERRPGARSRGPPAGRASGLRGSPRQQPRRGPSSALLPRAGARRRDSNAVEGGSLTRHRDAGAHYVGNRDAGARCG